MEEQIRKIIADALGVDVAVITQDLGINDIPEWNSMGNMAIIAALEEKLEIESPLEDLFELTNVEAIVEEINSLMR